MKLNSGNKEDNEAACKYIEEKAGQLDVIIANAGKYSFFFLLWTGINNNNNNIGIGISKYYGPLATTPISEFEDHWKVNAMGPVVLFQATHKLLLASPTKAPTFVVISTGAASISAYIPMASSAYGSSKTAVNFLVKVLDDEHAKDGLIAFAISPGLVATDMVSPSFIARFSIFLSLTHTSREQGNKGANTLGLAQAPVSLEDSVNGILSRIDGATREKSSGKFWNYKATRGNPWDIDSEEVPW